MRELCLRDRDGDRLTASGSDATILYLNTDHPDGIYLNRDQVAELRDYLTEWLGDQPADVQQNPNFVPTCCTGEDSSTCCPSEAPATILEDAQAAVYGDREADYGHPRQNFTRTAIGWHMVLLDKLAEGESITPEDVALCMVQVKVAREAHSPKRDNRVDGAGYFLTLDRLETGR